MKLKDLLEATQYISDIKQSIKDALIALKIQGLNQVETNQILKDFSDKGMPISYEELTNFIGNDSMIRSINPKFITFAMPSDKTEISSKDKVDDEKAKVQSLANKSLKKKGF